MPVGSGEKTSGVVDVLANKSYSYKKDGSGKNEVSVTPESIVLEVNSTYAELTELIAEVDDNLTENYLENGELLDAEFDVGLKKGLEEGKLLPVFIGSALEIAAAA